MPRLTAQDFDQEVLVLFDAYVVTAAGLLAALSPDFAAGQQVSRRNSHDGGFGGLLGGAVAIRFEYGPTRLDVLAHS